VSRNNARTRLPSRPAKTTVCRWRDGGRRLAVHTDERGLRNPAQSFGAADTILLGDSFIEAINTPVERTLAGELRFGGDDYTFTLSPSADYNRAVSLAALAGVYTDTTSTLFGEEVNLTVTIDADGRLNGSYSNGCVFNGTASIPDALHNMVRLQIDLANCGSHGSSKQWNGEYAGLGVLLSGDVTFFHSVIGPTWFGPQSVER